MSNYEPGPWELDEQGRRFRHIGLGCIEYPMTVVTSYGEFEAGNVPTPKIRTEEKPKTWGNCPFNSKCSPNCARFTADGCGLVNGEGPTVGRRCPFGDKVNPTRCGEDCALWTMCNSRKENS